MKWFYLAADGRMWRLGFTILSMPIEGPSGEHGLGAACIT